MNVPFEQLPPGARVWVFQADRPLDAAEAGRLAEAARQFTGEWTAHNRSLQAGAAVLHGLFLVLAVDEAQYGASGCSIDTSVRFVREMEKALGVSLLDRTRVAVRTDGGIAVYSAREAERLMRAGSLPGTTPAFDNLVRTKEELETRWEVPLSESWVMK